MHSQFCPTVLVPACDMQGWNVSTVATNDTADHDHPDPVAGEAAANEVQPHPGMKHAPWGKNVPTDVAAVMRHPVYTREYMESIKPHHLPPKEVSTGSKLS